MRELVDHDVVDSVGAHQRGVVAAGHGLPGQHDWAALHGLAGQLFVVGVDDAVLVGHLTARHHLRLVHHDPHKAVIALQAQVQDGQAGLGRHGDGNLVRHDKAGGAMEFLGGQEERAQTPQGREVGSAELGKEGIAQQRELPEGIGDGMACDAMLIAPGLPVPKQSAQHQRAMRSRPAALMRSRSPREAVSKSQSDSTWRRSPSPRSCRAGRWVWP